VHGSGAGPDLDLDPVLAITCMFMSLTVHEPPQGLLLTYYLTPCAYSQLPPLFQALDSILQRSCSQRSSGRVRQTLSLQQLCEPQVGLFEHFKRCSAVCQLANERPMSLPAAHSRNQYQYVTRGHMHVCARSTCVST
jgi:hypothetical protein